MHTDSPHSVMSRRGPGRRPAVSAWIAFGCLLLSAWPTAALPGQSGPPTLALSTRFRVANGTSPAPGARVLIASRPPIGERPTHGWRIDFDGPADAEGRVTTDLDRRRAHVAWAVDGDRGWASDLEDVAIGGDVALTLRAAVLQRLEVEVDRAWFEGPDAPTQVLAFDPRMPGVSFPAPLPRGDGVTIPVPPLPCATRSSVRGDRHSTDWIFLLADASGQWCVSIPEPRHVWFGSDGVAKLRFGAPEESVTRLPDEVDAPSCELRPIFPVNTIRGKLVFADLGQLQLGVARQVVRAADGAFRLRITPVDRSSNYAVQFRGLGRELLTLLQFRAGEGTLGLRPSVSDRWRLRGGAAAEGFLVSACDQSAEVTPEPSRLRVAPDGACEVNTTIDGEHRYDLFWLHGARCVPLALRRTASGAVHEVDLDGIRDVLLRGEPSSVPRYATLLLMAADADVRAILVGEDRGLLDLPVGVDGQACASLLPGEYLAVRGFAVTRFRVEAGADMQTVEVPLATEDDVCVTVAGRVVGDRVAKDYSVRITAEPIGELTLEQQVEVQRSTRIKLILQPGAFEMKLPRSIGRWRLTATADVPGKTGRSVPNEASCTVAVPPTKPVVLRLQPSPKRGSR